MDRAPLAEEVVRYIKNHIDSVPELETMMLLRATAPKAWTAAEVAARIYVDPSHAGVVLLNLERKKLLRASETGEFAFPDDGIDGTPFDQVASAYRTNVVAIAQLIHSKSSPALREFARAFRFKE